MTPPVFIKLLERPLFDRAHVEKTGAYVPESAMTPKLHLIAIDKIVSLTASGPDEPCELVLLTAPPSMSLLPGRMAGSLRVVETLAEVQGMLESAGCAVIG